MSDITQATLNLQAAPVQTNCLAASTAAEPILTPVPAAPGAEPVVEAEAADFAFHLALQPKDERAVASEEGANLNEVITQVMGSRDAQEAQPQGRGRKSRRSSACDGAVPDLVYELGQEFRELQRLMEQLGQDMSGATVLMEQITLKSGELTSLLLQAATQAQALSQRSGQVLMQLKSRK